MSAGQTSTTSGSPRSPCPDTPKSAVGRTLPLLAWLQTREGIAGLRVIGAGAACVVGALWIRGSAAWEGVARWTVGAAALQAADYQDQYARDAQDDEGADRAEDGADEAEHGERGPTAYVAFVSRSVQLTE